MNNLFDKIGSDLKNFSPEAPAYMEERIQTTLMSQKVKVRFWFSLNSVLLLVGLAAAGIFGMFYLKGNTVQVAQITATTMAPAVMPVAEVLENNQLEVPMAPIQSNGKPKGNFSERKQVTTPVITDNCGGAPEIAQIEENHVSIDSSLNTEVALQTKVEEVVNSTPTKKRRSLPITRLHKEN